MIKRSLFILFILVLVTFNVSYSIENKILFKLNEEIVTTIDISKEINYLKSINSDIEKFENKEIIQIAKNSLIRHKIKNLELLKYFKVIKLNESEQNTLLENTFNKFGFENIEEFVSHLANYETSLNTVTEKITTEFMWNQLVYAKYKNNIKIDEKAIRNELSKSKDIKQKKYLLSEIVFEIKENENLETKFKIIEETINNNSFEDAALLFSISESSKTSGNLGWINFNSLNKKIKNKLAKIKKGHYIKPIRVPGGFLIIKINDIREEKSKIDFEKEFNKIVKNKKNNQLKNFSDIYLNKILKNIVITDV